MQLMLIKNGTLYTTHGVINNGWLLLEDGRITAIGSGEHPPCTTIIDAQQLAILPGFIDLHTHGAVGCTTMQATPHALHTMAQYYAQHGVTSFLAATITDSPAMTERALQNIAACMGPIAHGATLLGAYLEGPCISPHAKGAHMPACIRHADPDEYRRWFEYDVVKQVTVAPEFPENIEFIKECVARGIVPSIGHSTADYEQVNYAVSLGATQATHTFNAMGGMHHRTPGTTGALLAHDKVVCELIADMVHVHPAVLKIAVRAKGVDKIILVTDAEIGAGLQPGIYTFDGRELHITDAAVYLPDGTIAGSRLTMNKALANCRAAAELSLQEAWPMTSLNQARQLGLEHRKGTLAVQYDADIVILDPHDYSVAMTIVGGRVVYNSPRLEPKEIYERADNTANHYTTT